MLFNSLITFAAVVPSVLGCAEHTNYQQMKVKKRADNPAANSTATDWAYEASFNWGKINPKYHLCQSGTQQAPIALSLSNGFSLNHIPDFEYPDSVAGNFYNWNYGPAFTLTHGGDVTTLPSFTYDNETVYLKGWHIHSPADHSVGGVRSKAEIHFVHVDSSGHEAAVVAVRLDPGNRNSTFFDQLPPMIPYTETTTQEPIEMNLRLMFEGMMYVSEFWTYQGSLTSPPCTEGIRFFVARQIHFTGVDQMREILGASTYSARAEQQVWQHRINE